MCRHTSLTPISSRSIEALERLAAEDPRKARVVELRFFGGLSVEETAQALGVSAAHGAQGLGVRARLALSSADVAAPHEHRATGSGSTRCSPTRCSSLPEARAEFVAARASDDEALRPTFCRFSTADEESGEFLVAPALDKLAKSHRG